MMDHPFIEQNEIVDRYLRGDLDESSEASFEQHLLTCSTCQDELELDHRLGSALRSLEESGSLPLEESAGEGEGERQGEQHGAAPAQVIPYRPRAHEIPPAAVISTPAVRRWQPLAWAASLLLALLPALLLFNTNTRLEEQLRRAQGETAASSQVDELRDELDELRQAMDEATRAQVDLPVLRLEPVRSQADSASHRLTLGEHARWIVLVIEPPEPIAERYALTLEAPTGELYRFEATPDAYGELTLSLFTAELAAGVYRLEATSPAGDAFSSLVELRR